MLNIIRANRFVKDLRLAIKRGFKIELLDEVVTKLANQEKLPEKYHDHPLFGNYKDFRECHIQPDWLLIYSIDDKDLELYLFRTGTHSDLY
ncbi:MAG: type II toxin-antitoxin system YafQ family toxin [Spirochaetia bacterium]|nr:type II toxin-antitoxin system YafQ family toxin [Spirochaetia bacterium]MBR5017339.1 type II toxin-antitoxin system YafQ family toxin [Spirochaetia bacterium]